eukprot:6181944-Pleurochrysis_carterae.AAC.1
MGARSHMISHEKTPSQARAEMHADRVAATRARLHGPTQQRAREVGYACNHAHTQLRTQTTRAGAHVRE